jgi:hypothetical protein
VVTVRDVLCIALACLSSPALARESLCNANESAVFSCSVGKKLVSLCATGDLNETTGALYYRYGLKDHVEMVFPENASHPKSNFVLGGTMYSGGGGDFVRFVKGEYTYTVYSEFGKGWEREGLTVRKDGKLVSTLPCRTPALMAPDNWGKVYGAKLPVDDNRFQEP